ncbi:FAD-binding protein [Candidatus Fermentibacteria bacterium]|nr:FAD-binding protein [Candidatus Fermentibacteria bacterium]
MRIIKGRTAVSEAAADLLSDESNVSSSWCEEAAWPESTEEAAGYLGDCSARSLGVTVSGGLTGLVAGALPEGGAVMSASSLKSFQNMEDGTLRVGAGVTLDELREYLDANLPGRFYPPDPTETTASIGGTVATDASGSDSLLYGSTRRWVEGLELLLPGDRILRLDRGEYVFSQGMLSHPLLGRVMLPPILRGLPEKNAAGYRIEPNMDLVDLLTGSEGTLGAVTSVRIKLARSPEELVDLAVFPEDLDSFWNLFESLRTCELRVRALEMMDPNSLDLLRSRPPEEVQPPPSRARAALFVRLESRPGEDLDDVLLGLDELLRASGVDLDDTWGGFTPEERSRLRDFRHSLPETVNTILSETRRTYPSVHKLGSDSAVPPSRLREYYDWIRGLLDEKGLDFLVFGHSGQGHLHANVLPRNDEQLKIGEGAMREIAERAVKMGGTVSAEHGLGRLKAGYISLMYSEEELRGMRTLRRTFDPDGVLAPAVTWP